MQYKVASNNNYSIINNQKIVELVFNKNIDENQFSINPNPASNFFNLISGGEETVIINLYNVLGEFIENFSCNQNSHLINVSYLPKGIYFLKNINSGLVKKLILQ